MGTPRAPGSNGGSGGPTNYTQGSQMTPAASPEQQIHDAYNVKNQMGGKNVPPPGNYRGAAEEASQANRPDQQNAYGSGIHWTRDANGNWVQTQSFGGELGGAADSLMGQTSEALSRPFDLSGLPQVGSGDSARQQAIDAAYGQSTSRLDPRFHQEEDALRARLLNQGLDENSEAFKGAMGEFGQQKNDAYTSAMNSAISQGTAAGDSIFRNNLAAHSSGLGDLLTGRGQALGELGQLQQFLQQPGFNSGPNYLAALGLQDNANRQFAQDGNDQRNDSINGALNLLGSIGKAFL
jgi:hypothetical protein